MYPEDRLYRLARDSGRQSHFYNMACVALVVRLACKTRCSYRFGSSGRFIDDASWYAEEQYEKNELAREVRAMTISDDDFSDAVKAIDKLSRLDDSTFRSPTQQQ